MANHGHKDQQHHHHGHGHEPPSPPQTGKKGLHKQWWFWVVIALMLGGMIMYIISLDESILP
jgi:hypothetical protein